MAEAVRFFWLRGEATLALSDIPEGEREPVRVRRSVAERYVPEVVKQLEENRFVAAAWPTGTCATMIGCHPNVAKGPGDGFILDTRSLPWVRVQLPDWNEAKQTARLLLAAFGSEAASADECIAARQRLAEWLEAHEQTDMATTVRRLMNFPIGFRAEALDIIDVWRHALVKGRKKEEIDHFMNVASSRFERLGWSRDRRFEDLLNRTPHQVNRFYCWVSGEAAFPRVMLCLNRSTERRVRGGTYDILEHGPSFLDLAIEIQRVLTEVVEPAAAETGLQVSYPRLAPKSRVGSRTEAVMNSLAEAAEGRWALPPEVEPLWQRFVVTAVREGVALNPSELVEWFAVSGWTRENAIDMANRFYADSARVGEYEEAGRQPA